MERPKIKLKKLAASACMHMNTNEISDEGQPTHAKSTVR
jgi:hypothetical protein